MDYPCAKFGDFSFSCFGFKEQADRTTESHIHRITDADDCYTHATTVGVSKYSILQVTANFKQV